MDRRNRLLTVDEVAEYLQVKSSTIYQWTHMEFIPHVKVGKFVRFRLDRIDTWLEKRSTKGRRTIKCDVRLK